MAAAVHPATSRMPSRLKSPTARARTTMLSSISCTVHEVASPPSFSDHTSTSFARSATTRSRSPSPSTSTTSRSLAQLTAPAARLSRYKALRWMLRFSHHARSPRLGDTAKRSASPSPSASPTATSNGPVNAASTVCRVQAEPSPRPAFSHHASSSPSYSPNSTSRSPSRSRS